MSGNNNLNNLNQFDDLIQELKQEAGRPSSPSATFKNELRSQLLNQYEQSSFSVANFGRWAGTAVALGVLAIIVIFSWTTFGQRSDAVSAQMGTVDVPDRDEFIVYDQLRIELPMWTEFDSGYAEMTAESWQSIDGTFFRGEVVDANGKQRVFVQGDGQFLWRGGFDSRAGQMETAALQYFAVFHALAQAGGWAGVSTTPPFYDDLGWDGLAQSVVRLDWDCTGAECINNYLIEPPLGINSRGGEYEPYGWGVSLIDTETTANGRSLTTYRIDYSPNQDGNASSQYRLVKLDSNSHAVVEVADYDDDTLLRRLERVTHQIMPRGSFPEEQFTRLPEGVGVSFILPEGRVAEPASLKSEPGGVETAVLPAGTHVYLDGIMDNRPAMTLDGITWRHVAAEDIGEGWIDETLLQWPLTFDGQLVELDTSSLPTAVPVGTQLIILNNYRAELLALSPEEVGENQHLLEQVLADIEAEIARLEQQPEEAAEQMQDDSALSSFADGAILTGHELSATAVEPGDVLNITLFWEGEPTSKTAVAVHLTDSSGRLLSQQDQLLAETMELSLEIPETLASGAYEVVVIKYDASTGERIDSLLLTEIEVGTAVVSSLHAANDVWLIAATQQARSSVDAPITLEITVGYQVESDEEVMLKLLYANPNWESASGGRIPIDGLSDAIVSIGKAGIQTIIFSESPTTMRQIAGTDQPVLVMQLGYLVEQEDAPRELKILAMATINNFVIDLTSTKEITFGSVEETAIPQRAIVSGTGSNGLVVRSAPTGQDIGILEEGSIVLLTDAPRQKGEGLTWQAVETIDGQTGWVVAEFLTYPDGYVPVDASAGGEAEVEPLDSLTIVNISPPVGSDLSGKTTFTITVDYALISLDKANLITSLMPNGSGAAVLGNDVQTISQGEGQITYSFEFEPLEPNVPSEWFLDIKLVDPAGEPTDSALASASPHNNFPEDVYRFGP